LKTFTRKDKSEVELRVSQELKNNQDFIYQTSETLIALCEGIKSLSLKHDQAVAKCGSDAKTLVIEFEKLSEAVLSKSYEMNQRLGDVEKQLLEVLKSFKELRDEVHLKYLTAEEFAKTMTQQDEAFDQLSHKFIEKTDYFNIALGALKAQFKDQLERVKAELTPIVPEIDPVQQKIDERFKVFKVDFDGLIREIAVVKQTVSYDQKKFENIYTLIERLKARVA
jgi:hypothetical protein